MQMNLNYLQHSKQQEPQNYIMIIQSDLKLPAQGLLLLAI